jgi:hypothetical protein
MTERNDRDLEEQFHALRREDAATAPPFQATLAAARVRHAAPPRRRMIGLAAAVVIIAGAALALLLTRPDRPDRPGVTIGLATVRWEAPTDFLLALPGDELLRAVPELGRVSLPGAGFTTITSDRRTP